MRQWIGPEDMKRSKNFYTKEFVPPEIILNSRVDPNWFVREEVVVAAQFVRDHFGKPMTINNWHIGGTLKYRGFRPPECTVGAKYSQHRFCNAFDFGLVGLEPEEIREEIIKKHELFRQYFSTIEKDTKTWVHVDLRYTGIDEIFEVNG
jgi:hypothetical protein